MIRTTLLAGLALTTFGWTTSASAIVIDAFIDPAGPAGQTVSQVGGGSSDSFALGSMLGGERDVSVGVTTGPTTITAAINVGSNGLYSQTQNGNDAVNGLVQWD